MKGNVPCDVLLCGKTRPILGLFGSFRIVSIKIELTVAVSETELCPRPSGHIAKGCS